MGRKYQPSIDLPRRCEQFAPWKNAEDQRTGKERWPGLDQPAGGGSPRARRRAADPAREVEGELL